MTQFAADAKPILVVDDSEIACEAVKLTLESVGYRVIALSSPFGFIKTVREQVPSLILLDVGLAVMSGTKLVQLARQHAPAGTPIVLYSGRDEQELQADVRESGADGFITKRTTGRALVLAVRAYLSRQQTHG